MSDKLKVSDTLPDITSPQADDDISLASSLQQLEHSASCSTDDIQNDNSTKADLQQTEKANVSQQVSDNQVEFLSHVTHDKLCEMQSADSTTAALRDLVQEPPYPVGYTYFYIKNDLLMRHWVKPNRPQTAEQVVVPQILRSHLLHIAHDIPAAGHMGISKTKSRLLSHFWWPRCNKEITDYVRSCDLCQRVGKGLHPQKAPLKSLPVISKPYDLIAMDIVGPLPKTQSGNRFILTVIDMATHFPEAIALPSHTAADVASALADIFSRFGFPDRILSDQGTDFMSELMQIFLHDFNIRQIRTSPYHPQSNPSLERFHKTMKSMIRCLVDKFEGDWDQSLKWVLFAYRELPVESLGFSPFELLFGRNVRGPLSLLKSEWTKGTLSLCSKKQNVVAYMLNLRTQLRECMDIVNDNARRVKLKSKHWYDKRARERTFKPGDLVLALLPMVKGPLDLKYQGPYRVLEKVGPVDYIVETPGRRKSSALLHVNLLKRYIQRNVTLTDASLVATSVVNSSQDVMSSITDDDTVIESDLGPSITQSKADNFVLDHLSADCRKELYDLLSQFPSLFNDKPGKTQLIVHNITLQTGTKPIKMAPYRVNPEKAELIRQELKVMQAMGVIEDSSSPWGSPVVLIPKPDGTIRFCVDYRKLNDKTVPDAHPLPRIDDLVDKIGSAKYLTKIDLSRGYWQVPLDPESIPVSAFVTPFGHFQWRYMPFGLRNAPATFQRLVWKVLHGLESFTGAYLDDIIIFSKSWQDHLRHIRIVFQRLQTAGLTLKKSKCTFATASVDYLGHNVGLGRVQPRQAKVQALLDFPRPANRKQLQSYLGLAGYYRRYIRHFAMIAAALTDMLSKGKSFEWTPQAESAFLEIKSRLSSGPVLKPPDFQRQFCIGVDASDVAIGACLFQTYNGIEHPICYYSKRLSPCQRRYSTVEKEAFALLMAVRVFRVYFGFTPVIVYSDHSPLQFIKRMAEHNDKLLRYSLELQQYNIVVKHRPGKQNVIPDILSRPSA